MNKCSSRAVAALLVCLVGLSASALERSPSDRGDQCQVHWRKQAFAPGEWPQGFAPDSRSLIMRWSPLARQLGYRMDLTSNGRVLTLSSLRHNRSVRREDRLVRRTVSTFDRVVAPAPTELADGAKVGREREQAAVLLRMHDRADYEAALEFLGRTRPYLAPWAASAQARSSFDLRQPNCSAWIEREVDRSAENELVHRLTRVLTFARYGEAPAWLDRGLAWHVELEVVGSIKTLPDADQQHGWSRLLAKTFGQRDDLVLQVKDFAGLTAKGRDELRAGKAWGLVSFLAEHYPGSLGPVLRDLGHYAEDHGRTTLADGHWEPLPGFQTPVTVQASVFNRHLGSELFAQCTEYFQVGSRYRMPAAR